MQAQKYAVLPRISTLRPHCQLLKIDTVKYWRAFTHRNVLFFSLMPTIDISYSHRKAKRPLNDARMLGLTINKDLAVHVEISPFPARFSFIVAANKKKMKEPVHLGLTHTLQDYFAVRVDLVSVSLHFIKCYQKNCHFCPKQLSPVLLSDTLFFLHTNNGSVTGLYWSITTLCL